MTSTSIVDDCADATSGWFTLAKTVREVDERTIQDYKEDIDTLLVFAGLFSAVMTSFVVDSYKNLQQDPATTSMLLLQQISFQLNSFSSIPEGINSSVSPPAPLTTVTFVPSPVAVRVNALWFASLIISLSTVSFGMLVKQWLREYLAITPTAAQVRLRIRHYRAQALSDWKVLEIAAVLPLLLQVSLGLFLVGLCHFTADVHSSLGCMSAPLVSAWALFLFLTGVAPLLFPRCPYRIAVFKRAARLCRRCLDPVLVRARETYYRLKAISICIWSTLRHSCAQSNINYGGRNCYSSTSFADEDSAALTSGNDADILITVDALIADDTLLPSIWSCYRSSFPSSNILFPCPFTFLQQIVRNRGRRNLQYIHTQSADMSPVSRRAWIFLTARVADCLREQLSNRLERSTDGGFTSFHWQANMQAPFLMLFSRGDPALPAEAIEPIRQVILLDRPKACHALSLCRTDTESGDETAIKKSGHLLFTGVMKRLRDVVLSFNDLILALSLVEDVVGHRLYAESYDSAKFDIATILDPALPLHDLFSEDALRALVDIYAGVVNQALNMAFLADGPAWPTWLVCVLHRLAIAAYSVERLGLPNEVRVLPSLWRLCDRLMCKKEHMRVLLHTLVESPHTHLITVGGVMSRALSVVNTFGFRDTPEWARIVKNVWDLVQEDSDLLLRYPLRLCFAVVQMPAFEEDDPFYSSWRSIFLRLVSVIHQHGPGVLSAEDAQSAERCLERMWLLDSGTSSSYDEEFYIEWSRSFCEERSFFPDELVEVLHRVAGGTKLDFRMRLMREKRHTETEKAISK
ncbi:hypothetical protein NM688_g2417 [Phlebia brevispora]|uniref:Uncharacterized protein n=1 Tax=Phlebia brevispora TaxID=194682 RepID=A0ACC1T8Y1_9APHY|nr:hypothetical protein NM688_g2417 [Phlebia brevispora]